MSAHRDLRGSLRRQFASTVDETSVFHKRALFVRLSKVGER